MPHAYLRPTHLFGASLAALALGLASPALADNDSSQLTTAELNRMSAAGTLAAMHSSSDADAATSAGEGVVSTDLAAASDLLLADWTGPYEGVPPWDRVDFTAMPMALAGGMAQLRAEFDAIIADPAPPSFANVFVPMELSGRKMDQLFSIWGVYGSNLSDDEVQAINKDWSPKISEFYDNLTLDPQLFAKIKAVYDARATAGLDAKQLRLVERTYDSFVRNGALLDKAQRDQLIALNAQLSTLFTDFSDKVLADEETFIFLTDAADLAGLPDSFVASIRSAAQEQGKDGWALKNTRSVVQPFLENSTRRDLREKVFAAFTGRGDNGNANDTNATIAAILKLRQERAVLLGFKTHAHYRMADTMAKDPEAGMDLMMQVWPAAVARVKEEVADMQAIADAEGAGITIAPWDYRFYAEKVRKAKYDLDSAEIKPYFQLDNMMAAMFDAAGKLYGMRFTENTGAVPVFHPDIRTFEVSRDGKLIGLFYLDNFARDGKRSGAWMTTYRSQHDLGGRNNLILASNNNNFVKGGNGEPTLISIDDASTLFHEFGHALHYLNYDITYPGLAGTPRDFVEYPSQVNENWLMTPYVLNTYAKHYQTGAPIPAELVAKIERSQTFNEGFATVEYLSSALVDMMLHNRTEPVTDPDAFEREALASIGMPAEMVMRHRLPQFNHLFSSDAYSAGYYSYLWSETMDADTWAAFEEAGDVWDSATAERFRSIVLATGNESDRKEAYRAFRGRDPDVRFILKKRGFPVPGESADAGGAGRNAAAD